MEEIENEIIESLINKLYPINRSITGEGLRKTIEILNDYIDFEKISIKSGTKVLNWTVPQEWKIKEAWIKDSKGNTIIDFKNCNLHVVNYSAGVNKKISLEELREHIYTIEAIPDAIPYITSYYKRDWGFCMSHNQFKSLEDDTYWVYIDADHFDGKIDFAHSKIKGESEKEILISSYICHPSMVNNELSGPIVSTILYNRLKEKKNRFTYRFVFAPETIGSISYLSMFGKELKEKMHAGIVLTCLGEEKPISLKLSRENKSAVNEAYKAMFCRPSFPMKIRIFNPCIGSDERQYCSPGFNLPVGQLSKGLDGGFIQYHNSLDNIDFIKPEHLIRSANEIERILKAIEIDGYYVNNFPYGEIKLDNYDLYPKVSDITKMGLSNDTKFDHRAQLNCILLLLNYSDGQHSLSEIAQMYKINILRFNPCINILKKHGLIKGPFLEKQNIDF